MNITRVYDFLKAKKHDQKIRKGAIKYSCVLPEYDIDIEFLSDEWYSAIEKGDIKEKTIKGFISSMSGDANDGKSYPIFELNTNNETSTWERKSDYSFFGKHLKDKFYKLGKNVIISYVTHKTKGIDKYTKIVKYIDIET